MSGSGKLEQLVGNIKRLPALPQNIEQINRMISSHTTTMDALGREISKDQALAAQVLKLVNSSFYGVSRTVASISHATVLLGMNTIASLVSTAWVSTLISKSTPGLYEHSLACARACHTLSKNLGIGDPEELSATGLLHDVGKMILAEHLQEQNAQIAALVNGKGLTSAEAEKTVMGVTHAEIGQWLLRQWKLPASTTEPICSHHAFDPSSKSASHTALLMLADAIVHAEGFGWSGYDTMPALNHEAMKFIHVEIGDLRPLMDELADLLGDIPRGKGAT